MLNSSFNLKKFCLVLIVVVLFLIFFSEPQIVMCMEPTRVNNIIVDDYSTNPNQPSTGTITFEDNRLVGINRGNPGVPNLAREGFAIGSTAVYVGGGILLVTIGIVSIYTGVSVVKNASKIYEGAKACIWCMAK